MIVSVVEKYGLSNPHRYDMKGHIADVFRARREKGA